VRVYPCWPVIDLHCHVLPGVDDGPATLDDSLALCRAAIAAGTWTIVATPHVSWEWPENSAARIAEAVSEVNDALLAEGLDLEVRPGAEVAVTRAADLDDDELHALCLGGGPWLLVECPYSSTAASTERILRHLQARGHRVVLAHPERSPVFQQDPLQLANLVASGMLCSVTAGSLVGRFGRHVRNFARSLMRQGLVHNIASDAHDAQQRPPGMGAEMAAEGYAEQADWYCRAMPLALISGSVLPQAPPRPPEPRHRLLRALRAPRRA
jgi:protein-tyrosine phosphatase